MPKKPKKNQALQPTYTATQEQDILTLKTRRQEKKPLKLSNKNKNSVLEVIEKNKDLAQVQIMQTTGSADGDAGNKLLEQGIKAQRNPEKVSNINATIALMRGIAPQDELEGMMAAQMVAVHNMALYYAQRAMDKDSTNFESNDRFINRTTKLMNVFTRQVEALQKYRTKGQQKITVQHVQVTQGGQAIIGDVVHPGGGTGDANKKSQ